jgi:hypothetical protein
MWKVDQGVDSAVIRDALIDLFNGVTVKDSSPLKELDDAAMLVMNSENHNAIPPTVLYSPSDRGPLKDIYEMFNVRVNLAPTKDLKYKNFH